MFHVIARHACVYLLVLVLGAFFYTTSTAHANSSSFSSNLHQGENGPEVLRLQIFLNTHGFPLAKNGPGSVGKETSYFGTLLRSSLINFQKVHSLPSTGYFGPLTRTVVESLLQNASSSAATNTTSSVTTSSDVTSPMFDWLAFFNAHAPKNIIPGYGGGSPNTFAVTPIDDGNETITPDSPQTVASGRAQAFTVTANAGYTVSNTVGGTCPAGSWSGSTYTTGAITTACSASFSASITTFTIAPTAGANGSISPSSPQTVNYGGSITFTATPDSGYNVNEWTLDGSSYASCGSNTTCALTNVTADHTIAVTFNGVLSAAVTPSSLSVYTNQTANFTADLTGGASPYSYQWYSCTDSTCVSTTAILGAISSTYSPSTDTTGTYYYQAVVTDSASSPETATTNVATLTVNNLPHIIFSTSNTYSGNLVGLSGADQKCNLDPGKPSGFASDYNYKALLNGNNATVTGTPYYRTDGVTLIATATGGNLVGLSSLIHSIDPSGSLTAWTGANGNSCSNWTSTVTTGDRGATSISTSQYWYAGTATCGTARALYCVSQ